MNNIHEFYQFSHDVDVKYILQNNVFAFTESAKHHWLQKICIYILRRLGCNWRKPTEEVTRVRIDTNNFMEKLTRSEQAYYNQFYRYGDTLLIGSKEFEEMMGTPYIRQMVHFTGEYMTRNKDRKTYIHNLQVKIVPHMSGMVVLNLYD